LLQRQNCSEVLPHAADSLNKYHRASRHILRRAYAQHHEEEPMTIGPISAAGLGQDVLSSGNSSQQQALQALQNSLASSDPNGAQSAFQTLQSVLQNSATANGTSLLSNSQLSTDLTSLGSALSSGNLSTAQSAFATVLGDLKNTASPAQTNEANAASQSVQLVEGLLSTLNSTSTSSFTSSSSADLTTSLLQSYYGNKSGINVFG
jgi:hypothetical protein